MTPSRRSERQTRTLQVWPGGASFEYRGDPNGPENQRSLRAGHYSAHLRCPKYCRQLRGMEYDGDPRLGKYIAVENDRDDWTTGTICPTCKGEGYTPNPIRNPWRKGTAEEWRSIRIELRAENYGERDIQGCDSSLVDDLLKAANGGECSGDLGRGFSYDEIRNIYADPSEWDADACREYIGDNGLTEPDEPADTCGCDNPNKIVLRHSADASCSACGGDWPGDPDDDDDYLTELREVCREHAQDNPAEVYEWWRVSSWLCGKLHDIGQVTIDNDYGYWWGRTCTGQGWIMDGVLQRVAALAEE